MAKNSHLIIRSEENMEDGTWKSGVIGTVRGQNLANYHTSLAAKDSEIISKHDNDGSTLINIITEKGQHQTLWNTTKDEISKLENE